MAVDSCNDPYAIATCYCYAYDWDFLTNIYRTTTTTTTTTHSHRRNSKRFILRKFSYSNLLSATDNFSAESILGKGSHGSVYKAVLSGGNLIAAVKITRSSSEYNCTISTAENEIEILSRVRSSPRLVNLLGFSEDFKGNKLIVNEFMPNGTLYDLLHTDTNNSRPPPVWAERVRFALQIAKAVQHLHSSNPPVLHRDIKSSNILIDEDWKARLGDFGFAIRAQVAPDVSADRTPPAGTLGYLDPAYLAPGDHSTKCDVFSFGIVLLEFISGRRAIDVNYSPPSLVDWAIPLIECGMYSAVCDKRIGPPEDKAVIKQLAELAARCVGMTERRPAMSDVVDCLRAINRRFPSPFWKNIRRRVSILCNKRRALDDRAANSKTSRAGSRRNRKVSSVFSVESSHAAVLSFKHNDQVA